MRALLVLSVLLVATLTSAANSQPTSASDRFSDAGIDDSTEALRFFERFRVAVETTRKKEVVAMLSYPIGAWINGAYVTFANAAALLKEYDQIFNERVKRALHDQNPNALVVSSQGIMVGRGEIWFGPYRKAIRVFAINNEFPSQ